MADEAGHLMYWPESDDDDDAGRGVSNMQMLVNMERVAMTGRVTLALLRHMDPLAYSNPEDYGYDVARYARAVVENYERNLEEMFDDENDEPRHDA